jgi:glycosyltransferase involved in cell wall biosynthesis
MALNKTNGNTDLDRQTEREREREREREFVSNSNPVWDNWEKKYESQIIDENLFTNWNKKVDNFKKTKHIKSKLIFGRHNPKASVSIVIPAYRRPDILQRSLDSALDQDFVGKYEIIVVDDSATGDSDTSPLLTLMSNYCSKFKNIVYYYNLENLGPLDNWNRCFKLARTDWLCLLHHDDALFPNFLSEMMRYHKFFESKEIAIASANSETIDDIRGIHLFRIYLKMFLFFTNFQKKSCIILNRKNSLHSIHISTNSMFVNRKKAISSGGLNMDYGLYSTIAWQNYCEFYYQTLLFPKTLTTSYKDRASGSLTANPKIAYSDLIIPYRSKIMLAKSSGLDSRKAKRFAEKAFIISTNVYSRFYSGDQKDVIKKATEDLGISKIYLTKLAFIWISIINNLRKASFLMFHRTKMKSDI